MRLLFRFPSPFSGLTRYIDARTVIVDLLVDRLPPLASTVAEEPASKRHLRVVGSDLSAAVELIEDGEVRLLVDSFPTRPFIHEQDLIAVCGDDKR